MARSTYKVNSNKTSEQIQETITAFMGREGFVATREVTSNSP